MKCGESAMRTPHFNYDLDAIYQDIKEQERKSNRKFVSLMRENIAPEKATQPTGLAE